MSHHRQSIFIVIPVHNRKDITLKCLKNLAIQGALDDFKVLIVDDGCTDGTPAAVQAQYPQTHVITGHGNLWWTGAIEYGMRHAYAHNADYMFWLNDDTLPAPGTLNKLICFCDLHSRCIASSQCYYAGMHTYGGQIRQRFCQIPIHAEPGEVVSCDALDGNLVCIPRSVIDDVGYPLGRHVPHYGGDNLYTWIAKQAGYDLCLLGDAISTCPNNHPKISWTLDPEPILKAWQAAASPKTRYYWWGYWHFCTRYWGILGTIVFIKPYLRLILFTVLRLMLPRKWLYFLKKKLGNS